LEFPTLGSLYFVDSLLDSNSKQPLDKGFCIWPHCVSRYWDFDADESRFYHSTKLNCGPCRLLRTLIASVNLLTGQLGANLNGYCNGLIDVGLSKIPFTDLEAEKRPFLSWACSGTPRQHLRSPVCTNRNVCGSSDSGSCNVNAVSPGSTQAEHICTAVVK
jgi:hypothetical protein